MHVPAGFPRYLMLRDLDALAARRFDVLVIGGGIHGLMAAWDAASRGLHTALIDRHDLGGSASFHHHRTLHGGLRYLQAGDLPRLRESVRERRTWARMAPHLIVPQAFAIEAGGVRGKPAAFLRAGFALDAVLAGDRNHGLPPALRLPAARIVGGTARAALDTGDLLPAAPVGRWYDYRTEHAERLTFAVARAAADAGAVLANYVDAIEPIRNGRRVDGVEARDGVDGERLQITAQVTINAAGAHAGRLMSAFGAGRPPLLVKAMNLVTRRPAPEVACGAPTAGGRLLFALPWQGRLSIGTWHGAAPCGADASMVTPEELARFLAEITEAFPSLALTPDDVTVVQRGVVPATMRGGRIDLADRPIIREHRQDGVDGAVTLIGVKYTTARAAAEQAVTLSMAQLGRHAPPRTAELRLAGGIPDDTSSPVPGLDDESWRHLQRIYGAEAGRVAAPARTSPALAARLHPSLPVTGAQVLEAARHEMALTLDDAVLRRTGLGSARYPGDEAVLRTERILREELGWTSTRVEDEIRLLKEFYLPVRV